MLCRSSARLGTRLPFFIGRLHFGLRIDAKGIGDAVDIIEVGDDFDGVENVAIAQAMQAQGFKVPCAQGPRGASHHLRELAQCLLARGKIGAVVVMFDVFRQLLIV